MKLFSWAFNNLSSEELLSHLLCAGNPRLDRAGTEAVSALLESFCRKRTALRGSRHQLMWATATQTAGRYLHYHSSRVFSRYPQYIISYHPFHNPPASPDWILLQWLDGSGFSREVMRSLNIQIQTSTPKSSRRHDVRRSTNHEDA